MKGYLIICLVFLQVYSTAQINEPIKFRVIDSLTKEPVAYGKIIISTKVVTLAVAPIEDGFFSITCGMYLSKLHMLTIISQNYDTLKMNIDSNMCIGDSTHIIMLKPRINLLQEVIVTSSLIRQDIDKITYNVAGDPESKFLTLFEFIPKLPFISLSPDDNPLFKGKSNFIVLLNGRRSSIFSNKTLRESLKAIPAANISKIEIITDPPPRYENEGYICVINIVTLKNPSNGYNAALNSSIGTFISGTNGSFNFIRNKFGFTFEGGGNLERTPYNSIYSETISSNFKIIQTGANKITSLAKHSNLLFSYEIDSLNLITLDLGANESNTKYFVNNSAESKYNSSISKSTYLFHINQKQISAELSSNLNYQKNFKNKKDRFLTLSYLLDKNKGKNNLYNTVEQSQNFNGNNYSQFSTNVQSDNAIQLDYVHPINKLKIESGAKYINRKMSSNYLSNIINPISGTSSLDTLNTGNLNYALSIFGIYNSYLLKLKSFSFRVGLRFESTMLNGTSKFRNNIFGQQYNNLLPHFKLQHKSKSSNIYSVGFKQQIQRPGVGLLNPLISKTAPGFGNSGNPNLKPVLINNVNLEFSSFKKASTSLALSYTFSKNTIQVVNTTLGDTLILTTFENISKYKRFGIENSTEIPITPKIDLSIDGSLYYVNVESKRTSNYFANDGIEGFVYSYLTYRFKKFRFTANLGYYGPTINIGSSRQLKILTHKGF